jgi:arsenate reductase (thioredoxin)
VTMGCGDECPYVPGRRSVDWDLADPAGRPLDEVRATRDDIARRVGALAAVLDGGDRASRGAA